VPSVSLIHPFIRCIYCTNREKNEKEPERTISHEFKIAIVIHRVIRSRTLEINNITAHPVLEFDSVFLSQEMSVLMMIIEIIVDLG